MSIKQIELPDIGGFDSVEIIELHVAVGDQISVEDPILTLESDKASMDIPSPQAGTVSEILVSVGDKIAEGSVLCSINTDEVSLNDTTTIDHQPETTNNDHQEELVSTGSADNTKVKTEITTEVLVLGAGPGGYTAAFRAADLGKKVTLVERYDTLGGVCLNVGCIPSKALLHTAQMLNEAEHMKENGVDFGKPKIDLAGVDGFKNKVVAKLTGGLEQLAKQRKVDVITGAGEFVDQHHLLVTKDGAETLIYFDNCIIAAGSQPTQIPVFPNDDKRLMDSTAALNVTSIPKTLLIVGGGIIGLEMATIYDALGSEVTVVEFMDSLMPGCDKDLVRTLSKRISRQY